MATAADFNLGEHTFPRGWFMIAESSVVLHSTCTRYSQSLSRA